MVESPRHLLRRCATRLSACMLTLLLAGSCAESLGPAVVESPMSPSEIVVLPVQPDSLKLAVFGDFGTGEHTMLNMAGRIIELRPATCRCCMVPTPIPTPGTFLSLR